MIGKEELGRFLGDIKKAKCILSGQRNFNQTGERETWSIQLPQVLGCGMVEDKVGSRQSINQELHLSAGLTGNPGVFSRVRPSSVFRLAHSNGWVKIDSGVILV